MGWGCVCLHSNSASIPLNLLLILVNFLLVVANDSFFLWDILNNLLVDSKLDLDLDRNSNFYFYLSGCNVLESEFVWAYY